MSVIIAKYLSGKIVAIANSDLIIGEGWSLGIHFEISLERDSPTLTVTENYMNNKLLALSRHTGECKFHIMITCSI
jgi:hypothetical protein